MLCCGAPPGGVSGRKPRIGTAHERQDGRWRQRGRPAAMTAPLAPYAASPFAGQGRRWPEPEAADRTPFQRDRDRILHSAAFRRLQYKTQVFVCDEGDHYRSRLTHSLEVGQIARGLCRSLALEETLAETLALAHDLGHTPFGHAGEAALDAALAGFGGFDHNVQTLRIVTRLEARYAAFDGLNLTWETLEGLAKHNGPVAPGAAPVPVAELDRELDLRLDEWPGLEAQAAALADDIAYNNHDIDDGVRAGIIELDDLRGLPLFGAALAEVEACHGPLPPARLIHETVRRGVRAMVADAVAETRRRIDDARPESAEDVRRAGRALVAFSDAMAETDRALKTFFRERLYRHPHVKTETDRARVVVTDLFDALSARPGALPPEWRDRTDGADAGRTARIVADYIAGMTDRFAFREHHRLCNGDPGPG